MPVSHQKNIYSVLALVDDMQKKSGVESILDIGTGFGKYGLLLRERMDVRFLRYHKEDWVTRIDGIEPFKEYITPVHKHIYDTLYLSQIEYIINQLTNYDIIIMIDVLEHLDKELGTEVLKKLDSLTNKLLILSFPIHPGSYKPRGGTPWDNKLEIHKCLWSEADISDIIGPVKHFKSTVWAKNKIILM